MEDEKITIVLTRADVLHLVSAIQCTRTLMGGTVPEIEQDCLSLLKKISDQVLLQCAERATSVKQ